MRLVIVCVIVNMLKCGSGCGTDRIPRNEYGDKMRHFNEFFASFLRFYVFDLCFFVMKCNIIVLIIHNISYIYSYFSKVVTETIVNCAIWALKG